jgi:Xaa-Pro aminopeptidase
LRKELCPEFVDAFREFKDTRNWERVEEARACGYRAARAHAEAITEIYRKGKGDMARVAREIEKTVLSPLGILKWKSEAEE